MNPPRKGHYDTIVAGAGPAGMMAARGAAERGKVLLLDSSSLPRTKSCGGMLNQVSQRFLSRFGEIPSRIVLLPEHVRFRYIDWDRKIARPTSLEFINVDRRAFDEWLLRAAVPEEVEIAEDCAIEDFSQTSDGVEVTLKTRDGEVTASCENLVGADGCRSTVRRKLGHGPAENYVTVQDYVKLEAALDPFFDCLYIRDIGDEYAYSYVVPKGQEAIVGSVFYPKTRRPWEKHDHVLQALKAELPQLGESVRREAAAAACVRRCEDLAFGSGRVLLAGEAGGFMSPTSGEGISYALTSGFLAGSAVGGSEPEDSLATYMRTGSVIEGDIRRRLRMLPVMESRFGKYLAGLAPPLLVDRVTQHI